MTNTPWQTHPALTKLTNLRIGIVGLAREGLATYEFLRQVWPTKQLGMADQAAWPQLSSTWEAVRAQDQNLDWHLEKSYADLIGRYDVLFISPGIPTTTPVLHQAITQGATIHSNTQLFFELCPCPIIGITGTKGKSTTTSLIHHVLHQNGLPAVLLGNIGIPPLSGLSQLTPESVAVVELSCHQLQHLPYSPHIAVIQNVTAEHLDYYPTLEAYIQAKTSIAAHQTPQDLVIFNPTYATATTIANLGQARQLTFSVNQSLPNTQATAIDGKILWQGELVVPTAEVPLPGEHNLQNVLPSVIIGKQYGLSNHQIAVAIKTFRGLPHRLELVSQRDGISYYNDSLATEPNATISALAAFTGKKVILLAGGYERHQDYTKLAQVLAQHPIKALLAFPPTGVRLAELFKAELHLAPHQPLPTVVLVNSMAEAVEQAQSLAEPGDIVLLSPAAASFGMFKDYQERGERFTELSRHQ